MPTLLPRPLCLPATEFPCASGLSAPDLLRSDCGPLIAEAISANSTANLSRQGDGSARALGNPTEGALLLWLHDHQVDYLHQRNTFTTDHQWAFTTERKYMATLGSSARISGQVMHFKGAPEILLQHCSRVLTNQGLQTLEGMKAPIQNSLLDYQQRGMRTLGFAYREDTHRALSKEGFIREVCFLLPLRARLVS